MHLLRKVDGNTLHLATYEKVLNRSHTLQILIGNFHLYALCLENPVEFGSL